jgi:hypothetical protein
MAIRKQELPFLNQSLAGNQQFAQQAFGADTALTSMLNQMPTRLGDKFIALMRDSRHQRFQESEASKARKSGRINQGIAAGAGALSGLGFAAGLGMNAAGAFAMASLGAGIGATGGAVGAGLNKGAATVKEFQQGNKPVNPLFDSLKPGNPPAGNIVQEDPFASGVPIGNINTMTNMPLAIPTQKSINPTTQREIPSSGQPTVDLGAPVTMITPEDLGNTVMRASKIGKERALARDADGVMETIRLLMEVENGIIA